MREKAIIIDYYHHEIYCNEYLLEMVYLLYFFNKLSMTVLCLQQTYASVVIVKLMFVSVDESHC